MTIEILYRFIRFYQDNLGTAIFQDSLDRMRLFLDCNRFGYNHIVVGINHTYRNIANRYCEYIVYNYGVYVLFKIHIGTRLVTLTDLTDPDFGISFYEVTDEWIIPTPYPCAFCKNMLKNDENSIATLPLSNQFHINL